MPSLLLFSVWRTTFVANEWNELQTHRRMQPEIRLLIVLFLLYACNAQRAGEAETGNPPGYEVSSSGGARVCGWACVCDAKFIFVLPFFCPPLQPKDHYLLRFAILVVLYAAVSLFTIVFVGIIYERFFEVREG